VVDSYLNGKLLDPRIIDNTKALDMVVG